MWVDFEALRESDLRTARAWAIVELFSRFWHYRSLTWARQLFERSYAWAIRSQLEPINKVALIVKAHLPNVLTYLRHRVTNAATEGTNAKIQWINAIGRGYTNRANFRTAILFHWWTRPSSTQGLLKPDVDSAALQCELGQASGKCIIRCRLFRRTDSMSREPTIHQQQAFYDGRWVADRYENRLKLQRTVAILDALARTRLKQPKIADLGCGSGWLTAILGIFGPATGFELSAGAVEQAKKKHSHATFQQIDLTRWDPPPSIFDIVVSSEVLEHVSAHSKHIEQARDLLRSGGYLILTTPNADTLLRMPEKQREEWTAQPIENWVTAKQLRRLLEAAGLKVEYITTIIPNYGIKGMRRFINSERLRTLASSIAIERLYDLWRLKAGYGLHLVVLAMRK